MNAATWIDEADRANPSPLEVAKALGLQVRRNRVNPCPCCGKDAPRHPSCELGRDGWKCWTCGAKGKPRALAHAVLQDWRAVRALFAAQGWCSPYDAPRASTWTPPPPRPAPPEAAFPNRDELLRLLSTCRAPKDAPELHAWFHERGWTRRLPAAVLPDLYRWPKFWPFREYRLVVSLVDASGKIVSMHGRYPSATVPNNMGKTRWPAGCRSRGAFFADPRVARPWLRGGPAPVAVLVTEGITSYLSAACAVPKGWAVLGADNGSFPLLPVPDRTIPTFVATDCNDPDKTGDRYWREAKRRIPHARRLSLPGRMDVSDLLHPKSRCSFADLIGMQT